MSGPYQWWNLSNYGAGRLSVAINCGVLSVKFANLLSNIISVVDFLVITLKGDNVALYPTAVTSRTFLK